MSKFNCKCGGKLSVNDTRPHKHADYEAPEIQGGQFAQWRRYVCRECKSSFYTMEVADPIIDHYLELLNLLTEIQKVLETLPEGEEE